MATTWALVTIRFGATATPLPWPKPTTSPSSIATVTTRTTLRPAAETSSARAGAAKASSAIRNRASLVIHSSYGPVAGGTLPGFGRPRQGGSEEGIGIDV